MIDSFFKLLAQAAELPREVWAPMLGLLSAWALTQRLKFLLPLRWETKAREVATQAIAFVLGTAITAAVYGASRPFAWLVGVVVGLVAPLVWNAGMLVLGWWKPELAKTLSQNVRSQA